MSHPDYWSAEVAHENAVFLCLPMAPALDQKLLLGEERGLNSDAQTDGLGHWLRRRGHIPTGSPDTAFAGSDTLAHSAVHVQLAAIAAVAAAAADDAEAVIADAGSGKGGS